MSENIELLKQILDDSNELIQVSDAQTREIVYVNAMARKLAQANGGDFAGKRCYEFMMGYKEPCPFCPMNLEEDGSFTSEVDNGTQVFLVKSKLFEANGKKYFIEYASDITDVRRSQQIYERSVERLITSIPDAQAVFHMDLNANTVVSVNGSSDEAQHSDEVQHLDAAEVDILVEEVAGYVCGEDARREFVGRFSRQALIAAYEDGKAEVSCDVESRFDDGSVRPARIAARLVMNPQTNHLECIVYGMDITEEKNREERQRQALESALVAAEHANRAKTTFLSNMSHDIRTPMNAIIGFTALAMTHIDNTELVQGYLRKISTSSTHLLSLINDVLDMSRIESGSVKIDENNVHIPDVMRDLRTIIQGSITSKQQDLFIDTQDIEHEDVITDKLRLNQVLLNIVSNAIKFTPVGGTVNVRVIEKPCSLAGYTTFEFRVKDNGIGMSEEFQEHVFDSFSRERSSTKSGMKGTGLGMAITKNIVDMMGGTISLTSEPGHGTEFVVNISCKLSDKTVRYMPMPELKGSRALVVDDDANTCMSVSKMLREIEMRPDWTTSGKEAVIRAKEAVDQNDEFAVFIIDWLMPDMNGVETVRRIRKVIGDSTPIIILTAYDWADVEEEARAAGVTTFVAKPLFMSELRAALTSPVEVEAPKRPEYKDFAGKRVLLVEDNHLNAEIAEAILTEAGFEVDSVPDGTDAVEVMSSAAGDKYDLILMDIQMTKMDGYTATREIRTLPGNRRANIPIIAMTANAFEEDRRSALEAGMNAHIAKPIDIEALFGTLERVFASGAR